MFYNIVDILFILIETDKLFFDKFNLSLGCMAELINFGNSQKKGLIDDLLNLCIFLKEKGKPFRILLLKLTKLYLTEEGYIEKSVDSRLFDRIGTFAIDTIASKKLNKEFMSNYSTLLSIEVLADMVEYHSYSLTDKLKSLPTAEGLSETGLERINTFNSLGWLTRFIHHRDSRVRFSTWNLLKSLVSVSLANQHPTLIDESLECFLNDDEIYSTKIASLNFLCKLSELLLATEGFMQEEQEDEESQKTVKMSYIIKCVSKHMFISKVESLLYQENVPALFA